MGTRIITGVIGAAAFLTLLWVGGAAYTWLMVVLALIAFYEFIKMKKMGLYEIPVIAGFLFVLLFVSGLFRYLPVTFTFDHMFVVLSFIVLSFIVITKNRFDFQDAAYVITGVLYVAFGFYYMAQTRAIDGGLSSTLLVIACVWATDTGAYFTGRAFGRHKLWPSISPNKTIEGAVGGIVMSVIVAVIFTMTTPVPLTVLSGIVLGVVVAIVGQMGDLIESALKRSYEVKDSGNILPGHGGILDRFDSMIIVFPVIYVLHLLPW